MISKNICSLLDPLQIGKHFLVKSTSHPITKGGASENGIFEENKIGIKRQYTNAFCMRNEIYENIIRLA